MSATAGSKLARIGGIPTVAAVVVFAIAATFHVYAVRPAEQRLERLQISLDKRAAKAAGAARPSRLAPQAEVAGKLGQFYAFFDGELTYVDWLARFYDVAQQTQVPIQRVEYRTVEPAGIPLVLHEVSVPVTADYARVRAFSEGVLTAIPVASLDQITFKRQRANQAEVEADLRFSFYLPRK